MCFPPLPDDPDRHTLKARNVAALRANFKAAGARTLIVSGVVDTQRGPDVNTLGGPHIVVARLQADPDELRARLRRRPGSSAPHEAVVEEAEALDRSTFADCCIDTSGLSIVEAATRVLRDIGNWPPAGNERSDSSSSVSGTGAHADGEVLWLSGTTGVGKSTVGFRAYLDVLHVGGHAAYVDIDQIGFCSTAPSDHSLRARNLGVLWEQFSRRGRSTGRRRRPSGHAFRGTPLRAGAPDREVLVVPAPRRRCGAHPADPSRSEGGSWSQPGDPLRDRPRDELLAVADRAIAAGHLLDEHDVGLPIDVDRLDAQDAAVMLLRLARWPAERR